MMSETKHTPEPWASETVAHQGGKNDMWEYYAVIHWFNGRQALQICQHVRGKANANRIVACVNACKGITDPEQTVPELLEACRGLLKEYNQHIPVDCVCPHVRPAADAARAAIAKATE
jgi:hypothetical protein